MKRTVSIVLGVLATATLAQVHAAAPSDAEIAAIVVAANQVDIDAGTLAVARAASADVRSLAERMVSDHTGVNRQASELVRKLGVTPAPSDTSATLKRDGDANLARLRQLEGPAFDLAYVRNEVRYHEAVIDALDSTLIPGAANAELKALLVKVRPAFVSHLEHARHLQTRLEEKVAP